MLRPVLVFLIALLIPLSGCASSGGGGGTKVSSGSLGGPTDSNSKDGSQPDTSWVDDVMNPGTANAPAAGRGFLLVACDGDNAVFFINPDTGRPFGRVLVGWDPREVVVASNGVEAYVSNLGGDRFGVGSISVLGLDGRNEIARIDLYPYGRVHGIVPTRSGVFLYVACEERNSVLEINLLARSIGRTFRLPRGLPHMMALNESETRLYVSDVSLPFLHVIDLTTGDITDVAVGSGPEAVVMDPEGLGLWVANRDDGTVSVLDPYTLTVQATLTSGRGPVRIAFTRDGQRALVVNAGESAVAVFDKLSRARISNIPVAGYPLGIALDSDGKRAYVASTRDDELSIIDLESNTVKGRIPVGRLPTGVAWVDAR